MLDMPYTMMHIDLPPIVKPSRITGVGRAKGRGPDKPPKNELKRKRKATKQKKQSRRRNRGK